VGEAHETVAAAMTATGVRRIVTILSYGAGATRALAPLPVRLLAATALRVDFDDLTRADDALAGADLDYTVCHFGRLTDGPPTGRARLSPVLSRPGHWSIARADLAALLRNTVADDALLRRRVVVSGAGR
jgi:hypothetical protein